MNALEQFIRQHFGSSIICLILLVALGKGLQIYGETKQGNGSVRVIFGKNFNAPYVEVLRVKSPTIVLGKTTIFCATPEEWEILKKAYPDCVVNADGSTTAVFFARKP